MKWRPRQAINVDNTWEELAPGFPAARRGDMARAMVLNDEQTVVQALLLAMETGLFDHMNETVQSVNAAKAAYRTRYNIGPGMTPNAAFDTLVKRVWTGVKHGTSVTGRRTQPGFTTESKEPFGIEVLRRKWARKGEYTLFRKKDHETGWRN